MFRSCQKYLEMVKNIRKRRRGEIEQLIFVFDIHDRNVQFMSEISENYQNIRKRRRGEIEQLIFVFDIPERNV